MFEGAGGIQLLRKRSLLLTGGLYSSLRQSRYFVPAERAVQHSSSPGFTIITPDQEDSRGAQLSLLFLPENSGTMQKIFAYLKANGVMGDERNPNVIRLAPTPLYNTEEECTKAVEVLNKAFESL
jgi:kynureninase